MNKWLKSLAIGDYKISFGQGLVISNDFSPGRSALVSQTERRTNGFRRHFSTNENDFFRGAAATVNWKNLSTSSIRIGSWMEVWTVRSLLRLKRTVYIVWYETGRRCIKFPCRHMVGMYDMQLPVYV